MTPTGANGTGTAVVIELKNDVEVIIITISSNGG
jgi:hypothetical protein